MDAREIEHYKELFARRAAESELNGFVVDAPLLARLTAISCTLIDASDREQLRQDLEPIADLWLQGKL